uniref:UDP-N-acetylglucosamine transferase subunit ALG14 n=1 Tax=Arion vulgaris TaxID=1028688 RepID=A0A0B6Z5Z4_9EUPU
MLWLLVYILLAVFMISIAIKMLSTRHKHARNKTTEPASVLIVVGSGGHTSEILKLVNVLGDHYSPRYYVLADTDTISAHKVRQVEKERAERYHNKDYKLFVIPRSREVKQSYLTSVLTTVQALAFSVPLVLKLRPDIILCNGPGTCIPICFAGLLLKWLYIRRTIIVYVESFCRVTSLSLSGKLLYHFSDSFCVQWPELVEKYPKAKYLGKFV